MWLSLWKVHWQCIAVWAAKKNRKVFWEWWTLSSLALKPCSWSQGQCLVKPRNIPWMLVRTQQTLVALAILQSYRFSRCHACRNDYDLMQSLQRSIRSAPGRLDAFGAAFEATGLVVACVAGGHILLATAGVAGFGLNAAQQYMTDSLGKLKKTYGSYRCYTWCYRCQVSTRLPCCQSGAWCWVQPGRWPGSDSVEGIKNFVNPSNPTNLRAILMRVALLQWGLHLKFSTLLHLLSSPLAKELFGHRSSRRRSSKWSPRWWIRGINFTRWSFRWHDRGTRPLLSPFLFGKKNDTPKKTRSSVGRMRLSQSALDGLQACLVLQATFPKNWESRYCHIVLNKMLIFFWFTYHSQPCERMCWMDVSCSGASSNIRCRTGRAKQTFDPTQSAQFEAVLGTRTICV